MVLAGLRMRRCPFALAARICGKSVLQPHWCAPSMSPLVEDGSWISRASTKSTMR
jgi:hypothetical protein